MDRSSPEVSGLEAVPELLRRAGLDVVFGMLGGSNSPWIAQGVRRGTLRLVRARHEENAVTAAAGYARSTGRVGLASTTRGPGFTNAVNALTAAARGHAPVLLITGEAWAAREPGSLRHNQDIDQAGIASIIGAGFHGVDHADELEATFWEALRSARFNGRPQILSLADSCHDGRVVLSDEEPDTPGPELAPDPQVVGATVDALAGARRPVLLAGWGAVMADCRKDLEELAEVTGARLTTTLRANRFFSGHPQDLGLCGTWSPAIVLDLLSQADVVLSVGASLNDFTTGSQTIFAGAKVIQCEIDDGQDVHASAPEFALLADARSAVRAVLDEWHRRGLPRAPSPTPAPSFAEIGRTLLEAQIGHDPARGLDPRQVYAALDARLPADRIVVTDNGRYIGTLPSLVDARDARSWLVGNSFSSVGLGLGAAIGAATAHPERPVVLFCGDGGLMMSAQDLDAVRIAGLTNITIIVLNDQMYGSEVKYLDAFGLPYDVLTQSLPDIRALAAVYGGTGHVVTTLAELDDLQLPGPGLTIVEVRVDPDINVRDAI